MRPFRFGVTLSNLPPTDWKAIVNQIEDLGYSTIFWPDHFRTQWDPISALAATASVTKNLNIGSFCSVDYRHPVVYAKSAGTLQLLSKGRHEFGIGAGWMESDYTQAGISFDPPSSRIERLNEALIIIRRLWTQDMTSFSGKHFNVKEVPKAVNFFEHRPPRILVGGGGRKVLEVAARHADIIGITPRFSRGKYHSDFIHDYSLERMCDKVKLARESAEAIGRNLDEIEFQSIVWGLILTTDPKSVREKVAKKWGVGVDDIERCGLFLIGSSNEIIEQLERQRLETGISYIAISESNPVILKKFANLVVKQLSSQ